ncbi:MAG TPA: sugar phosphate isomerase/epimerase family protein [Armatimonadota bacterium]|jgi:sugar phosphate isomerase/epimerase
MHIPFKTSVISDEISQNVETAVALSRSFGLDAIELRGAYGKSVHELTVDERKRIADIVGAAGMVVCAVAPPLFKCELSDVSAEAGQMDILRKSCAAARGFGTLLVRGFAFWKRGPLEAVKGDVVTRLKEAARVADGEGCIIALENEFSTYNCNVARTLELMDAVASPAVQFLYDPGNDIHDTEGEVAWPDSYELARGRFIHMHLKDPKKDASTGDIRTLAIGDGDVNIPEVMRAIIRDQYAGYVSLETHYRRQPMSHEVQSLPKGEDFSEGGYVASRECLEKWFAILETITNGERA